MSKKWSVSDISKNLNEKVFTGGVLPIIEIQDNKEKWHNFHVIVTKEKIVFGGCCNVGFIESGYIEREDGESINKTLSELLADLECYYNDGPNYVSRIVCNQRM